ncbi:NUDIX hydrolase [Aureivirga sp. CE67]|uniref:NUDIX hydrolase n=1 Tax=Aureivirga sp. CE67 TaxID=1788983 RepID=UPI0018CBD764|nr:CoA pyrophosphatase [Aureivirga sp. CE67]
MTFKHFLEIQPKLEKANLSPEEPFLEMMPANRKNIDYSNIDFSQARKAAVMCIFYPNKNKEACILLTLRASYNGTHSNQISFPGGKKDPSDLNSKETALRETFEEIGIEDVHVFKKMSKVYIPPSNFYVSPYIGFVNHELKIVKNHEVEQIIELPVEKLLDNSYFTEEKINTKNNLKMSVPCFKLDEYIIWGATAMMLNEIKYLIKLHK